jgi:AraC-like DNA-binding protein
MHESGSRDAPIPFLLLPSWLEAARECGFALEPILERTGIPVDFVHLEDNRIEQSRFRDLFAACIEAADAVGRAHFPFALGGAQRFEYLPELMELARTADTPRDALHVFDWVRALINPRLGVWIEDHGEEAWLRFDYAGLTDETLIRYMAESVLATTHRTVRVCFGAVLPISRIECRHPAPLYAPAYREHFATEVVFGARDYGLVFSRAAADAPLDGANPLRHRQLEQRLAQRFERTAPPAGLVARIEQALAAEPALLVGGLDDLARRFVMHPRTLQRRLAEQQQSFVEVQARVRMQLAASWLRTGELSIEEISERLGFSDRRGFTRAFTRWAGMSPHAYRTRGT